MANDLIWIYNTKTGKRRQIRQHLWELWPPDKTGGTKAEGWQVVANNSEEQAMEFTKEIQAKIVATPTLEKKSPVVSAAPVASDAMDMQVALNEQELNKVEQPEVTEVEPVNDDPHKTVLPETELVEVEDSKPAAKAKRTRKRK